MTPGSLRYCCSFIPQALSSNISFLNQTRIFLGQQRHLGYCLCFGTQPLLGRRLRKLIGHSLSAIDRGQAILCRLDRRFIGNWSCRRPLRPTYTLTNTVTISLPLFRRTTCQDFRASSSLSP